MDVGGGGGGGMVRCTGKQCLIPLMKVSFSSIGCY